MEKIDIKDIHVRVPMELKRQADALFGKMGMSTSRAVREFLLCAIDLGDMPTQIKEFRDENGFSPKFRAKLDESIKQLKEGRCSPHDLIEEI